MKRFILNGIEERYSNCLQLQKQIKNTHIVKGISITENTKGKIIPSLHHIIRYYLTSKDKMFMLIEDDAQLLLTDKDLLENFIQQSINNVPSDFDILLLGASHLPNNKTIINKHIIKVDKYSGNFFAIFNFNAIKTILNCHLGQPLDYQLSQKNLNIYFTNPLICKTIDNIYSSTQNKIVDYTSYWQSLTPYLYKNNANIFT